MILNKMTEYYKDKYITLYLGDSRKILPELKDKFSCIITDPVWPNTPKKMFPYVEDSYKLFKETVKYFPKLTDRIVIQLGVTSDPRFLNVIPKKLPFLRACWLELKIPSYFGKILIASDVAYVFGSTTKGKGCIPGIYRDRRNEFQKDTRPYHPCSRKLAHMQWLVKWFAESGPILDPFAGACTTLIAAKKAGIRSVGIEINERYCENAVKKIEKYNGFDFEPNKQIL